MNIDSMYASSFTLAQKIGAALGYAAERIEVQKGHPFRCEGLPKLKLDGKTVEELAAINIECALRMADLLNQVLPHLNEYEASRVLSLLGEEAGPLLA